MEGYPQSISTLGYRSIYQRYQFNVPSVTVQKLFLKGNNDAFSFKNKKQQIKQAKNHNRRVVHYLLEKYKWKRRW